MFIMFTTIALIIGTLFLMKNAKKKISLESYALVLIGGLVTFLFEPMFIVFFTDRTTDGGAIQIVSTLFGIYSIGWSVVRMAKYKKEKDTKLGG